MNRLYLKNNSTSFPTFWLRVLVAILNAHYKTKFGKKKNENCEPYPELVGVG